MKAILVREHGGPEVLKLEDLPDPKPGADQVVMRLKAVGVNPVDVYIRSGAYARKPALPFIPGSDAAGEIEAVGANVKNYKAGDRVFIHGTAAENTHGHYGGRRLYLELVALDGARHEAQRSGGEVIGRLFGAGFGVEDEGVDRNLGFLAD